MVKAQTVPHNLEAEKSVLGAVLIHRDAIVAIAPWLEADDFYQPAHRAIYAAMLACYTRQEPCDLVTVAAELEQRGRLDDVRGMAYLSALMDGVPTAVHVEYYARIVRATHERRQLIQAAGHIARLGYDSDGEDPVALRARAVQSLIALSDGRMFHAIDGQKAASDLLDELGRIGRGDYQMPRFGLRDLDELIMLRPGSMTIIAGRTSEGKTALGLTVARRNARAGMRVLYATTETRPVDLCRRLVSGLTGIPFAAMWGEVNPERMHAIAEATAQITEWPGSVDFLYGKLDGSQIRLEAMARRGAGMLDLLVVDYIQQVRNAGKTMYEVVTRTSGDLQALATELEIPVVVVSQLSRKAVGKAQPTMDDLKESGAQEQDADAVLLLQRDQDLGGQVMRPVLWWLDKNRNGPLGKGSLLLDAVKFLFTEL